MKNKMIEFAERVKNIVLAKYEDLNISIKTTIKNNDLILTGLMISDKTEQLKCTPIFYIDQYYDDYHNNPEQLLPIIASFIDDQLKYVNMNISEFKIDNILDLNKVVYTVINKDRNTNFLSDKPYFEYLDLAIIFKILLGSDGDYSKSITVDNNILEKLNIGIDDLYNIATKNINNYCPVDIKDLKTIMLELIGEIDDDISETKDDDIYVVKNNIPGINTVLLNTKLLKTFANHLNSDLYIIPSSIHECLIVSKNIYANAKDLKELCTSVNCSMVDPSDILSDNIYEYTREGGKVKIAESED